MTAWNTELVWILGVGIFWLVCGVFAYGFQLAYFQREYPSVADDDYVADVRHARFMAVFGPFGLWVALKRHGLMFRRPR